MPSRMGGNEGIQVPENLRGVWAPNVGFPSGRLQEVHDEPDQTHDLTWEGLGLRIYLKSSAKFTDLVTIQLEPEPVGIVFALRAFPSLCEIPLGDLTPLELLERIAEKYGLEISIAGKRGKFFLCEKLTMPQGAAESQLLRIANPDNHEFAQFFFIRPTPPNINIALAFCLDTREYGKWLQDH